MATLIALYSTDGTRVGRCDSKCYTGQQRTCICQGANHGTGFQRAQDNTRENAKAWVDAALPAGETAGRTELHWTVRSLPLFTVAEIGPAA